MKKYAEYRGELNREGLEKASREPYVSAADKKVLDYFKNADNFAKLKALSDPPAESVSVSKVDKSMSDAAYKMDQNGDGLLTKDEIDTGVKDAKAELVKEDTRRADEVKQYEAATKRFASIIENFSKLSGATGGDAHGISKDKVREAQVTALTDAIVASIKENGTKMPADIRQAGCVWI